MRPSGTPLYIVVLRELQEEIVKGVYPVGTQLPSESSLVERFGVSRQTVRQALRTLREAGLVKSHQGLGTIVQRPGLDVGYVHQVNTIGDLFPVGVDTHYLPVEGTLSPLPEEARVFSDLPCEGNWLTIKAHRFKQGADKPFNLMHAFIAARFAGVGRIIADHKGSIYSLIENLYGETIEEVEQVIASFEADQESASVLDMESGEAGVEVRRSYWINTTNEIALLSINRYPTRKFNFSMKLRRVRT